MTTVIKNPMTSSDVAEFTNCARVKVTSCLLDSDFGDFDGSDEKLAFNSEAVTYRIRCYHGGDRAENKGHISLYINGNAGPEGDKIITFTIRIRGDVEIKTFRLIAANAFSLSLPKFISHNDVKKLFDKDSALTIECTATCQQI
uniref:DUF3277 family protein n=1 Tax=Panagrellus redivivus TaxID=6233 RepID=A0A7E4VRV9_PANRE